MDKDPIRPFKTEGGEYMIEFTFAIPTEIKNPSTGNPIMYAGRCDMIGVLMDSIWVTDEKTTTSLGEQWAKQWLLDSQMTGYIYAARKHGFNAVAALVRGVGLLKRDITHAEAQVHRGQWELDRWWNQLHDDLNDMVKAYERFDFRMALDKHMCNAFGGCPFLMFCDSQDPKQWANQYRVRVWDPTAKDFGEKLLENPVIKQQPGDDLVIDLKDLM